MTLSLLFTAFSIVKLLSSFGSSSSLGCCCCCWWWWTLLADDIGEGVFKSLSVIVLLTFSALFNPPDVAWLPLILRIFLYISHSEVEWTGMSVAAAVVVGGRLLVWNDRRKKCETITQNRHTGFERMGEKRSKAKSVHSLSGCEREWVFHKSGFSPFLLSLSLSLSLSLLSPRSHYSYSSVVAVAYSAQWDFQNLSSERRSWGQGQRLIAVHNFAVASCWGMELSLDRLTKRLLPPAKREN